jgi:hypothetical protein
MLEREVSVAESGALLRVVFLGKLFGIHEEKGDSIQSGLCTFFLDMG